MHPACTHCGTYAQMHQFNNDSQVDQLTFISIVLKITLSRQREHISIVCNIYLIYFFFFHFYSVTMHVFEHRIQGDISTANVVGFGN